MGDDRRERWRALVAPWGAPATTADAWYADLAARYASPARRYHTLEHVGEVLDAVDLLAPVATHADAVRLAAWFHDAVYDPRRHDNEAASAELARAAVADLGPRAPTADEVARLIRCTAGHDVDDRDTDGAVLVDADLAVLGAAPARYDRYATDVRAEYAHVDDGAWRSGRTALLTGFVGRDHLFHTAEGRRRWDASARANLRRELDRLRGDGPR